MGVIVLAELVLGIDAQEPLLIARQVVQRLAKGRLPFGSRVLRVLLKVFFVVMVVVICHRQLSILFFDCFVMVR